MRRGEFRVARDGGLEIRARSLVVVLAVLADAALHAKLWVVLDADGLVERRDAVVEVFQLAEEAPRGGEDRDVGAPENRLELRRRAGGIAAFGERLGVKKANLFVVRSCFDGGLEGRDHFLAPRGLERNGLVAEERRAIRRVRESRFGSSERTGRVVLVEKHAGEVRACLDELRIERERLPILVGGRFSVLEPFVGDPEIERRLRVPR